MTNRAVWYYQKEGEKEGPLSLQELREMFERGDIDANTKIWAFNLDKWVSISEVEHIALSSLDEAPPIKIEEKEVPYTRETDEDRLLPRPWVRFWARMIDYSLLSLVVMFLATYLKFLVIPMQSIFWTPIFFIWVFIETLFVTFFGKTPGKWLLNVMIRDEFHQKLKFGDSLNRSFSVWWLGMGAGIPIISFITMIIAAVKLSNTGETSWDRHNRYRVFHKKVGITRILVTIGYFFCYLYLINRWNFNLFISNG